MIKILKLTGSLMVGGAEQLILTHCRLMARDDLQGEELGHHLCAFGNDSVFGPGNLLAEAKALPVPVKLVRAKFRYSPRATLEIYRYIRDHRFDIIHTDLTSADILGNLVGGLQGIPVICTLHNMPEDYRAARRDLRFLFERLVLPRATTLVALSDGIRKMWIDEEGISGERIVSIPNCADTARFLPISAPRRDRDAHAPLITAVGRLEPQKAFDDLLRAAALVFGEIPGARLRIVGRGQLDSELKSLAASLGIASRVEFAGLRSDMDVVLEEADLFVQSSLWEGMSIAILEAMAAALPTVLTDVGANGDLIADGVHGRLVPKRDPKALADAMLALLADPSGAQRMGLAARRRAIDEYSTESYRRRHLALYRQVMTRARGR